MYRARALMLTILLIVLFPAMGKTASLDVRVGQTHSQLATLQKILAELKYQPGRTDGFYSMLTVKALEQFQRDHKLPITGRPDAATNDLLYAQKTSVVISGRKENVVITQPQEKTNSLAGRTEQKPVPQTSVAPVTVERESTNSTYNSDRPAPAVVSTKAAPSLTKSKGKTSRPVLETDNEDGKGKNLWEKQQGGNADKLLKIAGKYKGVPYRFGGTTSKGFDCSGYTQQVFKELGISLYRTADQQFLQGIPISKNKLRKGDLVFFSTYEPGASHVGIYDGAGKFWNASSSKGVIASNLNDPYYWGTRYIGARRILK